jgi:hypothetical protein
MTVTANGSQISKAVWMKAVLRNLHMMFPSPLAWRSPLPAGFSPVGQLESR